MFILRLLRERKETIIWIRSLSVNRWQNKHTYNRMSTGNKINVSLLQSEFGKAGVTSAPLSYVPRRNRSPVLDRKLFLFLINQQTHIYFTSSVSTVAWLLPTGKDVGSISLRNCNGEQINVCSVFLEKSTNQWVFNLLWQKKSWEKPAG